MKRFRLHALPIVALLLLIFITFQQLPGTFFQQDEWQYFGSSIYALASNHPVLNVILPLKGQLTHFFPLATIFFLYEYIFFKTNFAQYAFLDILFQIVNVFLFYFLIYGITKRRILAFGSAALFAVNSIAHQPVTWVAAGIGTLPGTMFLLLFFLLVMRYLKSKSAKTFYVALLCLVISMLFKETSLFVFVFFPLMSFIYRVFFKSNINIAKKEIIVFCTLAVLYGFLRLAFMLFSVRSAQPEIGDVTTAPVMSYVFRLGTLPFKTFAQSLFPAKVLLLFSDAMVYLAYPHFVGSDGVANPYFSQSIVFDLVTYILSAVLFVLSYFVWQELKRANKVLTQMLVMSIVFIGTSSLPFAFVPGIGGYFSIFEPRDLYVVGLGSSLFIAIILFAIARRTGGAKNTISIAVILITLVVSYHALSTRKDIENLLKISTARKNFLTMIQHSYPVLSRKVVFYTESDRSYYGLPIEEKILPVQSGFGRMLMVWYQDSEKFPGCLYEEQFLHGLTSQGYKFCESRGFGYARDYTTLLSILRQNNLLSDSVIGYSWDGKTQKLKDITKDLRTKVSRDL